MNKEETLKSKSKSTSAKNNWKKKRKIRNREAEPRNLTLAI